MKVLSARYRWDLDGVDILGTVSVNAGASLIQFPISGKNLKYLHGTTPTAVYVLSFIEGHR